MNQSTNYNFNLPEGTDLVNLLTQLIPNWASLDTLLKGVEDQAITNCTEVVSLGVHAITRTNTDGKILKWIATANYTAGDTFTIDGNLIAAATASGEALATNAIVSGAVILAALNADESAMTIFVTGTNVASDSEKLGGQLPSYYAKESDMSDAKQDITDLDNLMGSTSISAIGDGTVTGALSSINTDLANMHKLIKSDTYTATSLAYAVCFNNFYNQVSSLISAFDNATKNRMMFVISNADGSNDVYNLDRIENDVYYFTQITAGSPTTAIRTVKLASSSSFIITLLTTGGINIVDSSASAIGSARTLELYI